jgi:hypothetical protein
MAKLLYNVSAYENTAAKWATDTRIYPANSLLIESDTGILKKGDGVKTYANLATIGAKQDLTVADITDFPSTMPPSAHDHAVADITDFPSTMPPSAHDHAVADITDFPSTMPPSAHDHAVIADAASALLAASTIQELAVALSTRIKALEDLATT